MSDESKDKLVDEVVEKISEEELKDIVAAGDIKPETAIVSTSISVNATVLFCKKK